MLVGGDSRRRRRGLGEPCCALGELDGNGAVPAPLVTKGPNRVVQAAFALGLVASAITIGKFFFATKVRKKVRRARYTGHRLGPFDRSRTLELPAESMADVVFERRR